MRTQDLIEHFSRQESLPIDVNDVLSVLLGDDGIEDDVKFIAVELDTAILRGWCKIWHERNGVYGQELTRNVNVYYVKDDPNEWKRFVCCKELMHLLDPESARTETLAEIDQLAARIGLPPELQDPMADGVQANTDRLAELRAAAVLLPLAARDILLSPLADGKITLPDIAELADIPGKYAGLVMSSIWPRVHEALLAG
jgi:hypothetical protein